MFHLKDKQLHILMGTVVGTALLLFCFFAVFHTPPQNVTRELTSLSDYSQGWIATYKTTDADLAQKYQKEDNEKLEPGVIRQVVNFPAVFQVERESEVTLNHKVPDLGQDTRYVVLKTKQEHIRVTMDDELLYECSSREGYLPMEHIIAISPKYKNCTLTIQLTGKEETSIAIEGIYEGDYSQVLVSAWQENGGYVVIGGIFVLCGCCFFTVWLLVHDKVRNKRALLYSTIEVFGMGTIFLLESRFVKIWMGWNFGGYLLEGAVLVITAMVHIVRMRCVTHKKRLVALLDMGCLACGVFYVSTMVLQGFSLLHLDTILFLSVILCGMIVLVYTVIFGIAVYVYKWKENLSVFLSNLILVAAGTIQLLHEVFLGTKNQTPFYLIAGIIGYAGMVMVMALKQALDNPEQEEEVLREENRMQVIEELNPNLLFASFHTLQNLIKSGSANSAKMLYYISVYFRSNLKAMKQPFEQIPFGEELEHILSYLTLQKTRNGKMEFSVGCKVKEFTVPRRCLEPMVENAVMHGLSGKPEWGTVVVRTYEREDGYAVQIIDDGVGFSTTQLKKSSATSLKVILEHLENKCDALTEVISRPGKGTVITIIFPYSDMEEA